MLVVIYGYYMHHTGIQTRKIETIFLNTYNVSLQTNKKNFMLFCCLTCQHCNGDAKKKKQMNLDQYHHHQYLQLQSGRLEKIKSFFIQINPFRKEEKKEIIFSNNKLVNVAIFLHSPPPKKSKQIILFIGMLNNNDKKKHFHI